MRKTSLAIFTILLSIGLMGCGADGKESKSEEKEVSEDGEKQSNEGKEAKSVYTVESYIKSVEKNLAANSETLISNMKELQTYTIYSKVELLDFIAFIVDDELSISVFSMDRQANEVFKKGKDADVFSGSREMIENVEYNRLFGDQNNEFWEFYDENEEAIELAEKQAVAAWVADCWKKANGQAIKLPAYFSLDDDDDESYDLNKNQWVDDEEKWD